MSAPIIVPFNNQPALTSFKTTSYTIPSGRYARVTPVITTHTELSGTGVFADASGICKWTINANTVYSGHTTFFGSRAGSSSFNVTLPTQCSCKASFFGTGSSGSTVTSPSGIVIYNAQYFASTEFVCNGGTLSMSVPATSIGYMQLNFYSDLEPQPYWLKAGDVIAGSSNYKWLVEEYSAIS